MSNKRSSCPHHDDCSQVRPTRYGAPLGRMAFGSFSIISIACAKEPSGVLLASFVFCTAALFDLFKTQTKNKLRRLTNSISKVVASFLVMFCGTAVFFKAFSIEDSSGGMIIHSQSEALIFRNTSISIPLTWLFAALAILLGLLVWDEFSVKTKRKGFKNYGK